MAPPVTTMTITITMTIGPRSTYGMAIRCSAFGPIDCCRMVATWRDKNGALPGGATVGATHASGEFTLTSANTRGHAQTHTALLCKYVMHFAVPYTLRMWRP